jgi:tetratricopeptide (TPR) repeat protein
MTRIMQVIGGDALDLLTKATIVVLTVSIVVMLFQHRVLEQHTVLEAPGHGHSKEEQARMYQQRMERDKILYQEVEDLFNQRQYTAALEALEAVRAKEPNNPLSLLYQARLEYQVGRLTKAISTYRLAIEAEPDYVDRKSPLFFGEELQAQLDEAQGKLQRERSLKPGDGEIATALNELLYLKRRIAGGCE